MQARGMGHTLHLANMYFIVHKSVYEQKGPQCLSHSVYWSPPPPPAVVYFFQAGVFFSTKNVKFWHILACFGKYCLFCHECTHFFGVFLQALIMWCCTKSYKYGVRYHSIFQQSDYSLKDCTLQ